MSTQQDKTKHMPLSLDHAHEGDTRYFILHAPVPKGISPAFGYPICDSMNRHHDISPEEDQNLGRELEKRWNCHEELVEALKAAQRHIENPSWGGPIAEQVSRNNVLRQINAALQRAAENTK